MNKKGFANIALVVLIVVLVGAVGYFVLRKPVSFPTTQVSPPFTNQTSQNSTLSDIIADWKTYRSDKYGFEVKYPPTWLPDLDSDGSDLHIGSPLIERANPYGNMMSEVVIEIQALHSKSSSTDLFSFAKSQTEHLKDGPGWPSGEVTKVNLYGLSVVKVDHSGGEGQDGPGYYIEKNPEKFFYVLVYGQKYPEIVNRIISTITFLK